MSKVFYEIHERRLSQAYNQPLVYVIKRLQNPCEHCKHAPSARTIAEFPADAKEFAESYVSALNGGRA
jgi:hypothetical protein